MCNKKEQELAANKKALERKFKFYFCIVKLFMFK